MSIRPALLIHVALLSGGLLSACATSRQIAVDYPKTETSPLTPIKGQTAVTPDDYYVQIVSEFEFKGDNALKGGCSDIGASYESGDLSAALLFNISNEALKLKRETSGFLYQATTGKCNFKLETKKVNLTPWLRLDSAKDTQVEYSFLTSNSREANLSQLVGDINAASGLMALTGVGTGIAVMGKLAGSWVEASAARPAVAKPPASAKYSSETHNLPASVALGARGGHLNQSRLAVYEVVDGGMKAWADETRLLGEMRVYPELSPSLLLKSVVDGVPDAHDLSLDELLRLPIQTAAGEIPLRQLIDQVDQAEKPNLNPDWRQYDEVENQCRRLKLVLKGLGFNKYDRNAVLYYFLAKSADWKNFNITPQKAMADAIRPRVLEQYRGKDFAGCLADDDYVAMQSMRLPVNTAADWDDLSSNRQKKEGVISSVQSVGRQLLTALSHPDKDEVARQLYPLLTAENGGNGSVLLQNHLGNFGLETLLQLPAIPDEGLVISAAQFATVIAGLNVDSFSCVRPALNQGQPLANIGITLFVGKPGSPREQGGALEFETVQGKITRLAFQHSSYRDFEQTIADYPDLGGCRIEAEFLKRLH
ncbi:hypothetical protein NP590_02410 [Methylomonas sp. SURF-2]|uniref:Uncharacterized protein n=1 Tax=Methylomonas subterranea TaxID=2952225 RepID=A0ABT1TCH2_9GAMM|nr:hypothetical protein [Methylomonas sp. SURF-2]MCQ8102946.1 hypothetical protein [Methylomonas sp. SURF-2]